MTDAITASLSRQSGLLSELQVIANNIANASTTGFKKEAAVFAEYVEGRGQEPSVSFGALRAHFPVMDQGAMVATGGVLDVAIEGEGWFGVRVGGEVLLTRAGQFQLDGNGIVVNQDGYPVLDEAGGEIQVPEGAPEITVGGDGTVTANGFGVAQIGVLIVEAQDLTRVGGDLWRNSGPTRFAEDPRVRQGFLEGSNVSAVEEMARLIETQRLFEAGVSLAENEHERIQAMIEALGVRS